MFDILIELLQAFIVGWIVISLARAVLARQLLQQAEWRLILAGFILIFFGSLIDITDNFDELNRFILIGNTETQAFLEKVVGYLAGFMLLAVGFWRLLPGLTGNETYTLRKLEIQEERLKVMLATMNSVNDIVLNFLHGLQLYRHEAEKNNSIDPKVTNMLDTTIQDTIDKLTKLSKLDSTPEKKIGRGTSIDYE